MRVVSDVVWNQILTLRFTCKSKMPLQVSAMQDQPLQRCQRSEAFLKISKFHSFTFSAAQIYVTTKMSMRLFILIWQLLDRCHQPLAELLLARKRYHIYFPLENLRGFAKVELCHWPHSGCAWRRNNAALTPTIAFVVLEKLGCSRNACSCNLLPDLCSLTVFLRAQFLVPTTGRWTKWYFLASCWPH